ncbi:MAG: phosphoribosylamine--glycine ligase [Chitinophagaceae bacterium]
MNILLLGSGGREHALAWKIVQSPLCKKLFIAPGNAGTLQCGINTPVAATDFEAIENIIRTQNISLVVVGPEEPLVKGVVDYLNNQHTTLSFGENWVGVIGPSKNAAKLEGSKAFAKAFMQRHNIPTAAYKEFTGKTFSDGVEYIHNQPLPVVVKADGLAAGKGVIICSDHVEAVTEFELMTKQSKFGKAGKTVVVEEFLSGIELSVFILTDGKNYLLLPEAKDYKRIGEGDTGANTGGMGAISPVPFADTGFRQKIIKKIIAPTVQGLQKEKLDYKGFLFFGLMKVDNEPYVIEYNCRMGDPETEVVIPRIKNDLVELFVATVKQNLNNIIIKKDRRIAASIMAVSGGYPGKYNKGVPINGVLTTTDDDTLLFHAGTKKTNGQIETNGGRVFCVTSLAKNLQEAIDNCKQKMSKINFEGKYYRSDIGYEFLPPATTLNTMGEPEWGINTVQ